MRDHGVSSMTEWGRGTVDMARLDCVKCGRKLPACRCVNATPGIRRIR